MSLIGLFAIDQIKEKGMNSLPLNKDNLFKANLNIATEKYPISEFRDSSHRSDSFEDYSLKMKYMSGSNSSSINNKPFDIKFAESPKNKKAKEDLSIKTDSSSDEYEEFNSTDKNLSNFGKIHIANTPQNSELSLNYPKKLQRKSISVMNGGFMTKLKRDSISTIKKEVTDMNLNLYILNVGNTIKINKNRINYAVLLKSLIDLFIRNNCHCDLSRITSKLCY